MLKYELICTDIYFKEYPSVAGFKSSRQMKNENVIFKDNSQEKEGLQNAKDDSRLNGKAQSTNFGPCQTTTMGLFTKIVNDL